MRKYKCQNCGNVQTGGTYCMVCASTELLDGTSISDLEEDASLDALMAATKMNKLKKDNSSINALLADISKLGNDLKQYAITSKEKTKKQELRKAFDAGYDFIVQNDGTIEGGFDEWYEQREDEPLEKSALYERRGILSSDRFQLVNASLKYRGKRMVTFCSRTPNSMTYLESYKHFQLNYIKVKTDD